MGQEVRGEELMGDCIQNCRECERVCLETLARELGRGAGHEDARHLRLLMDCAEICRTSASFMIRGSELHFLTCFACGEVCERCAEECERMADDMAPDPVMLACAEVCRRCAGTCRAMSEGLVQRLPTQPGQRPGAHAPSPTHA